MTTQASPRADADRWARLVSRRGESPSDFYYAVVTTGIFCRPGCASRLPRRENVRFFDSPAEARAAGYRPCQRCRPEAADPADERRARLVRACRRLEEEQPTPTLADLAAEAGLSRWHFQRQFRRELGVTPRQYAAEYRARRLAEGLQGDASITEVGYRAGYGSSSRVFEAARERLSMSPSDYRRGAPGQRLHYGVAQCELGWFAVAASERGLCAIELDDSADALVERLTAAFPGAELRPAGDAFDGLLAEVARFLDAPGAELDLPLDIRGTAFQCQVWQVLRTIPAGQTLSYAQLAEQLGRPEAVRAVAGACAANHLAVAIPCHRVRRADGSISGYRWGPARKRRLLEREAEVNHS